MPRELSPSEEREFAAYMALGSVEDVRSKLGKLPKAQSEAAESRKRIGELEKELAEANAGKPKEGAVVLEGDEATAYTALKAAGVTLKQASDGLKERDTLKAEVAARQRRDALVGFARAEGWAEPEAAADALLDSSTFAVLEVKPREQEVEISRGNREKRTFGFVSVDGADKRLGEWVQEKSPVLHAAFANGSGNTKGGSQGLPAPDQRGSGGGNTSKAPTPEQVRAATRKTVDYTSL